jgi:hypothetical protein
MVLYNQKSIPLHAWFKLSRFPVLHKPLFKLIYSKQVFSCQIVL